MDPIITNQRLIQLGQIVDYTNLEPQIIQGNVTFNNSEKCYFGNLIIILNQIEINLKETDFIILTR